MMTKSEAVAKWTEKMYACVSKGTVGEEWFESLPAEQRERWAANERGRCSENMQRFADVIEERGARLCDMLISGSFNTRNSNIRGLFHDMTGVKLPANNKKTIDVVGEWVGSLWPEHKTAKDEDWKRQLTKMVEEQERSKEEADRKEKEAAEESIRKGESITGRQLVDMCAIHGITLALRTKGSLLGDSFDSVSADSFYANRSRKGNAPKFQWHPSSYYKAIQSILKGEDPSKYLPSPKTEKPDPYAGMSPARRVIQKEIDDLYREARGKNAPTMRRRVEINQRLRVLLDQLKTVE